MPKIWLYILIIGFGIFVILSYESAPQNQPDRSEETTAGGDFPNYFLDNFQTVQFGEDGELRYQLSAIKAEHFQINMNNTSPDDYTLIDKPEFIFFQSDQSPWQLTAQQGRALGTGETISLEKDVLAWQALPEEKIAEISTPQLLVYPQRQFAETDKPVTIDYPSAEYQGDGMEVDFEKQLFTLLTNVKGSHAPQRPE